MGSKRPAAGRRGAAWRAFHLAALVFFGVCLGVSVWGVIRGVAHGEIPYVGVGLLFVALFGVVFASELSQWIEGRNRQDR